MYRKIVIFLLRSSQPRFGMVLDTDYRGCCSVRRNDCKTGTWDVEIARGWVHYCGAHFPEKQHCALAQLCTAGYCSTKITVHHCLSYSCKTLTYSCMTHIHHVWHFVPQNNRRYSSTATPNCLNGAKTAREKFSSMELQLFDHRNVEKRWKQVNANLVNYQVSFIASTFVRMSTKFNWNKLHVQNRVQLRTSI